MSAWAKVGDWLKDNAGTGAALVGSLLTGNVPGAVAAGVAMVSSATGTADPDKALQVLQSDPQTMLKLRELAVQDADNIRKHIQAMEELRLSDEQAAHQQTQETIRNADNAEDPVVRRTRPGQSWLSLLAAIVYVFTQVEPDFYILGMLLTLPWAYAGLRQVGKGIEVWGAKKSK